MRPVFSGFSYVHAPELIEIQKNVSRATSWKWCAIYKSKIVVHVTKHITQL